MVIYAYTPMDEYVIIDVCKNNIIELGDKLSKIFENYPNLIYKGKKRI
jgi:hypothetical protein